MSEIDLGNCKINLDNVAYAQSAKLPSEGTNISPSWQAGAFEIVFRDNTSCLLANGEKIQHLFKSAFRSAGKKLVTANRGSSPIFIPLDAINSIEDTSLFSGADIHIGKLKVSLDCKTEDLLKQAARGQKRALKAKIPRPAAAAA